MKLFTFIFAISFCAVIWMVGESLVDMKGVGNAFGLYH